MKSKIFLVVFALFISVSLSACSGSQISSARQSGSTSAGSGVSSSAGTSAGSSAESSGVDSAGSEDGSPAPADEKSRAMEDGRAVLQNEANFICAEDGSETTLEDFLKRDSAYEGIYQATQFAVLDLDGDGVPEVVVELSLNGYPEEYEILHDIGGTVYGYNVVYRGMETLKADGTFCYADSATDVGVEKILRFKTDGFETELEGYAQADSSGGQEISFFIGKQPAAKEDFDAFLDQQDGKTDAPWHPFSQTEIEAEFQS